MSQRSGRFTVGVQLVSEGVRDGAPDIVTPAVSSSQVAPVVVGVAASAPSRPSSQSTVATTASQLTAARISSQGVQKSGRFTVSTQQNVESEVRSQKSEVDEAEHFSATDATVPSVTPSVPDAVPCSLEQLEHILEAQQDIFTKTWEDMKQQVYRAILHKDGKGPPPLVLPNTPTSNLSTSSNRTPPMNNGSDARSVERGTSVAGSSSASNWPIAVPSPNHAGDNARENTLQMWSHLGSTLREVVLRNEQLEDENRNLRAHLETLQYRITDANQALGGVGVRTFPGNPVNGALPYERQHSPSRNL